jgi:hypothetical protein
MEFGGYMSRGDLCVAGVVNLDQVSSFAISQHSACVCAISSVIGNGWFCPGIYDLLC